MNSLENNPVWQRVPSVRQGNHRPGGCQLIQGTLTQRTKRGTEKQQPLFFFFFFPHWICETVASSIF